MTETDLNTLVHDHVARSEPPFLLQPEGAIARGRRTVRRRRALGAGAAALAIAVVAVVPQLVGNDGHSDDRTGIDPATQKALDDYDAQQMPAKLRDAADAALQRSGADLGTGTFTAADDQQVALPAKYWDKASSMSVTYGGATDDRFTLLLMHSASEAEGNAKRICANELAEGLSFSCVVTTAPNGDIVTTRVMAMRPETSMPGWGALTREELRTGVPAATDPRQDRIDPSEVWFERSVESVHSDTFLTSTYEKVKAPDLATAEKDWSVSTAAMEDLVTDPTLVIPKPPIGSNHCAWMLHPENIRCGVKAPAVSGD